LDLVEVMEKDAVRMDAEWEPGSEAEGPRRWVVIEPAAWRMRGQGLSGGS
jgi:mRNA-degrading endonuclease toxin of MazEF toxin-antitoxin module